MRSAHPPLDFPGGLKGQDPFGRRLFDDESFDVVLTDTALHMIPDYQRATFETARVLAAGGAWVCSAPVAGISGPFDAGWNKSADRRGLHSLTEATLQDACLRSGGYGGAAFLNRRVVV